MTLIGSTSDSAQAYRHLPGCPRFLGRLRVRSGDPEAWPPLDEALELARGTGTLQHLAPVGAARAEAAWLEGDLDRVRSEAEAFFELTVQARHPWFVGELAHWRSLAGALDAPSACATEHDVRSAVDAYTRLRELGATRIPRGPRTRTQRHPAGLTPREAQLLSRSTEGLSNAQIADRHRVGRRTMTAHRSAYPPQEEPPCPNM